jgi:chromate transporter
MEAPPPRVGLATIAVEWLRIGGTGFGGPPAHIALLRRLCVQRRGWISAAEFEDGIAATNLLPGPASTQLAIYCAWRLRGTAGALLGGFCFISPGLVLIIALAALLLSGQPNPYVLAAAAGMGAAVAAIAVHAAAMLVPASRERAGKGRARQARWFGYAAAGALATILVGPWVVLVLVLCGLVEVGARGLRPRWTRASLPWLAAPAGAGGLAALCWSAFKVGALSYGGGFVIIPLMQSDAVDRYHWMTDSQFLYGVALGQITPGPVVQTVAVVGYAAAGVAGAVLAAVVAFAPSFVFVIAGARHFDALRRSRVADAFLTGAGPAAIGAIAGSAVLLGLAISHGWQIGVLVLAAGWLLLLRRGVVSALLGAGALGLVAHLAGLPIS